MSCAHREPDLKGAPYAILRLSARRLRIHIPWFPVFVLSCDPLSCYVPPPRLYPCALFLSHSHTPIFPRCPPIFALRTCHTRLSPVGIAPVSLVPPVCTVFGASRTRSPPCVLRLRLAACIYATSAAVLCRCLAASQLLYPRAFSPAYSATHLLTNLPDSRPPSYLATFLPF
eukprot:3218943-Pleurochrysis_carterae.AAC.2